MGLQKIMIIRLEREPIHIPKSVVVLYLLFFAFILWRGWNARIQVQKYHEDCSEMKQKSPTAGACYETKATATYVEERGGNKVYWYYVHIILSNGHEMNASPPSNNPPPYLNAASINGPCYIRVWQDEVMVVWNNKVSFISRKNPETRLTPIWMFIILELMGLLLIWSLYRNVQLQGQLNPSTLAPKHSDYFSQRSTTKVKNNLNEDNFKDSPSLIKRKESIERWLGYIFWCWVVILCILTIIVVVSGIYYDGLGAISNGEHYWEKSELSGTLYLVVNAVRKIYYIYAYSIPVGIIITFVRKKIHDDLKGYSGR